MQSTSKFPLFPAVPILPRFLRFPIVPARPHHPKKSGVSRLFDADRCHFLKLNNFVVILNANYANFTKIKLAKLAKFESFALKGFDAKEKNRVSGFVCHRLLPLHQIVDNVLNVRCEF